MELRHLRYFAALADELHFGHAAENVFVAQSTLSQQIQAFEEELGVQEIRHMESLLGLVAAGLGVSTAHRSRAQSRYSGVCYALITEPVIPLRMGLAWRQGDASPVTERFLRVVRRVAALE